MYKLADQIVQTKKSKKDGIENHGKKWSKEDDAYLWSMLNQKVDIEDMAIALGQSTVAIYYRLYKLQEDHPLEKEEIIAEYKKGLEIDSLMKKILSLFFLFAALPIMAVAQGEPPLFGKYGFSNHKDIEEFHKYEGKKVMYLPNNPLTYAELTLFQTTEFERDHQYEITKISTSGGLFGNPDRWITIYFKEKDTKKKLKIKTTAELANYLPFFFIEDFIIDRSRIIGKTFSNKAVKGQYVVTDMRLETSDYSPGRIVPTYYVKNKELGISFQTYDYYGSIQSQIAEDLRGNYISSLVRVEKLDNPKGHPVDFKTIDEDSVTKFAFEDKFIRMVIVEQNKRFGIRLTNLANNTIKLIWDEAVFVDSWGYTSKLLHSGIKTRQRELSLPASVIIRGATLNETAFPTQVAVYSDALHEWIMSPEMFPKEITAETRQIQLMLPVQIKDVVKEYIFVFDVRFEFYHPERINFTMPQN